MAREKKAKNKDDRVGFAKLTLWQSSSVSVAVNSLIMMQVTFYCTEVLKLNAALMGTLLLVSKLSDGVTDLVVGFIIDRTNTKWGKGRPYEIFMVLLWLTTFGLFAVPPSFSTAMKYIWVFVMYIFVNSVCKTFLNCNNVVYMIRAFKTKEQQVKVMAYGGFYTMAAGFAFNIFFPMIMARIATDASGWARTMLLFAIPLTAVGLLRMLFIPEQYNNEDDTKAGGNKLNFKDIKTLFETNRYFVVIVIFTLIYTTGTSMGAVTYYWKYIIGDLNLMGVTAVFSALGLPLAFLIPRWTKKYGMKKMCTFGFCVTAAADAAIFITGSKLVPFVVLNLIAAIAVVPYTMMSNLFIVELADYNEYQNRFRMEGTMAAFVGLMGKVGGALGGFFMGILMTASGYDGSLDVLPNSALIMIRLTVSLIPAVTIAISVLLFRLYKLDDIRNEIKEFLDKKRNSENNGQGQEVQGEA